MKYQHGKFFKKGFPSNKELVKIEYSPAKDEYYSFVKKQREKGFGQVIVTSEMMIKIIKDYFLEKKFRIAKIEFMIEDNGLENEVNGILNKLYDDRGYFNLLVDKLMFLIEESSIDIKKIDLKGRSDNKSTSIYVQVNGVFGINENDFLEESENMIRIIKGCI